jgi:hypothetical protein
MAESAGGEIRAKAGEREIDLTRSDIGRRTGDIVFDASNVKRSRPVLIEVVFSGVLRMLHRVNRFLALTYLFSAKLSI